jgi:hypothetical protein
VLAMWGRMPRERQRLGRIAIIFPYELNPKFDILNTLWVHGRMTRNKFFPLPPQFPCASCTLYWCFRASHSFHVVNVTPIRS